MNIISRILPSLRHGKALLPWSVLASWLVRLGGVKIAATLTYLSIDWAGVRPGRVTVLCLGRESFFKDIKELRERTDINFPTIRAGFTRFQAEWLPTEAQEQTYYQNITSPDSQAASKMRRYAECLIALVSRKVKVDAVMSANFDYWQDAGFKDVCRRGNIPFLVLSREHPIIPLACDIVSERYNDARYRFKGDRIAVAGPSSKQVICERTNACDAEDVVITGLPRYDAWLDISTDQPKEGRPYVTLLSFTKGYFADETFKEVLSVFCQAANSSAQSGLEFLVKTKSMEDTIAVREMAKTTGCENVLIDHEPSLFYVLPKSTLVVGYNSLSVVEAVMARASVVLPGWGQCHTTGDTVMYPEDMDEVASVVNFARDKTELYKFLANAGSGVLKGVSPGESDRFVDRYVARPRGGASKAVANMVLIAVEERRAEEKHAKAHVDGSS